MRSRSRGERHRFEEVKRGHANHPKAKVPGFFRCQETEGHLKKTYAALLILLLVSALSFSQSRETGAITGKVTDEQGAPCPAST